MQHVSVPTDDGRQLLMDRKHQLDRKPRPFAVVDAVESSSVALNTDLQQ